MLFPRDLSYLHPLKGISVHPQNETIDLCTSLGRAELFPLLPVYMKSGFVFTMKL